MEMGNPSGNHTGKPARPDKEQVRRWLAERVASRQPLPEPEAIRCALGWLKTPAAA